MTISVKSSSKKLSILADRFVPDYVKEDYPKFVEFLAGYFKFIEKNYVSNDVVKINNTDEISDETISLTFSCKETHVATQENHPTGPKGGLYWEFIEYVPTYETTEQEWVNSNTYFSASYGIYRMITDMLEETDIDKNTIDDYLVEYKRQYLSQVPLDEDLTTDKIKLILKNVREFYKAKGTEASYKFLFNIVYGSDVVFYYPKVDILKTSDGRWNDSSYIVVNKSGQELSSFYDQEIQGITSGARAFVSNDFTRLVEEDNDILYLTKITGDFLFGEGISIRNIEQDNINPDEDKEVEVDNATIISKKTKWGVRQDPLRQTNARAYSSQGFSVSRSGDLLAVGAPAEEEINLNEDTTIRYHDSNNDEVFVIGDQDSNLLRIKTLIGDDTDHIDIYIGDNIRTPSGQGGSWQYNVVTDTLSPQCTIVDPTTNLPLENLEDCVSSGGEWIHEIELQDTLIESINVVTEINKVLNIESTDNKRNAGAVYLYRHNGTDWVTDTFRLSRWSDGIWSDDTDILPGRLSLPEGYWYYQEQDGTTTKTFYDKYNNEFFGYSVSLVEENEGDGSNTYLAIGAPGDITLDTPDNSAVGHVYIYVKYAEDTGWKLHQVLDPDFLTGEQIYGFGYSVEMNWDGPKGKPGTCSDNVSVIESTCIAAGETWTAGKLSLAIGAPKSNATGFHEGVMRERAGSVTIFNMDPTQQKFIQDHSVFGGGVSDRITPAYSIVDGMFGSSIGLYNNFLVVGEPNGIGKTDAPTYLNSLEQYELDPINHDKPLENTIGAAHVFYKADDNSEWVKIETLAPEVISNDTNILNSHYGYAIDISEKYIAITAPQQETPATSDDGGVGYVYNNYTTNGTSLSTGLSNKIFAEFDKMTPFFGASISISESEIDENTGLPKDNDRIAISAPKESDSGVVYVFSKHGNNWKKTYVVDNPHEENLFGGSGTPTKLNSLSQGTNLNISDDYLFIGQPEYMLKTGTMLPYKNVGDKELVLDKENWKISQDLIQKNDGSPFEEFGSNVTIISKDDEDNAFENDRAFISEIGTKIAGTWNDRLSSVHVMRRDDALWTIESKIIPSHYLDNPKKSQFGSAMSGSGNTILIGAWGECSENISESGRAYIYETEDNGVTWNQSLILEPPLEFGRTNGQFGYDVFLSKEYAIVSAPKENVVIDGTIKTAGAVYVYKKIGQNWVDGYSVERLHSPWIDHKDDLQFGKAIAFNHATKTLAISGINADVKTEIIATSGDSIISNVGKVFIFEENNLGYWNQYNTIVDKEPNSYKNDITLDIPVVDAKFGASLCMCGDGNQIAIGVPGMENGGTVHTIKRNSNGLFEREEATNTKSDVVNTAVVVIDPSNLDYEEDKIASGHFIQDPTVNNDIYFNVSYGKIESIKDVTTIKNSDSFDELSCHHYGGTWGSTSSLCTHTNSYCSDWETNGSCSEGVYCSDWETVGYCSTGTATNRTDCEAHPNYGTWTATHYDQVTCVNAGSTWIESFNNNFDCTIFGGIWYSANATQLACEDTGNTWTQGTCKNPTWLESDTITRRCYIDNGGDVSTWSFDNSITNESDCIVGGGTWLRRIESIRWDGGEQQCEVEVNVTDLFEIRTSTNHEGDVKYIDNTDLPYQLTLGNQINIIYYFSGSSEINYKIISPTQDMNTGDEFGSSVKISDNYLTVGAPGTNGILQYHSNRKSLFRRSKKYKYKSNIADDSGAVYVFNLANGGTKVAKIEADFYDRNERFGEKIAISGDHALVSSRGYKIRRGRVTALYNDQYEVDSGIIKERGFYYTTDGFLDSSKVMQDNFIYQEFSYMLDTTEQISEYREVVKDNVHPVGMQLIGLYNLGANIDVGSLFDLSIDYILNISPEASGQYINPTTFHNLCRDTTVVWDESVNRYVLRDLDEGVIKTNTRITELMHERIGSCLGDDISTNLPPVDPPLWQSGTSYDIGDVVAATSIELNHTFAINRKDNIITLIDREPNANGARITVQTNSINIDYTNDSVYAPENYTWKDTNTTGTQPMFGDINDTSFMKVYFDGVLQTETKCFDLTTQEDITSTYNSKTLCENNGGVWKGYTVDTIGNNLNLDGIETGTEIAIEHYRYLTNTLPSELTQPSYNFYNATSETIALGFDLDEYSIIEVYCDGVYQSNENITYDYLNNSISIVNIENYTNIVVIDMSNWLLVQPQYEYFDYDGSKLELTNNLFDQTILQVWIDGVFQSASRTSAWRPNTNYVVGDVIGAPDDPTSAFIVEKIYDDGISAQMNVHMPEFDHVEMGGFIQDGPVTPVFDEIGSAIIRYDRVVKIIWRRVPIIYDRYFVVTTVSNLDDGLHTGLSGPFEPIWKDARNSQIWDNQITWTALSATNYYDDNIRPLEIVQVESETYSSHPNNYPFVTSSFDVISNADSYTIELGKCYAGNNITNATDCNAVPGAVGQWNTTLNVCEYIKPSEINSWTQATCEDPSYGGTWENFEIVENTLNNGEVIGSNGMTRYALFDTKAQVWKSAIEYNIGDLVKYWNVDNNDWAIYECISTSNRTYPPSSPLHWELVNLTRDVTTGQLYFINASANNIVEGFYELVEDGAGNFTMQKWTSIGTIDYNTGIININNLRLSDYISAGSEIILKATKNV